MSNIPFWQALLLYFVLNPIKSMIVAGAVMVSLGGLISHVLAAPL